PSSRQISTPYSPAKFFTPGRGLRSLGLQRLLRHGSPLSRHPKFSRSSLLKNRRKMHSLQRFVLSLLIVLHSVPMALIQGGHTVHEAAQFSLVWFAESRRVHSSQLDEEPGLA